MKISLHIFSYRFYKWQPRNSLFTNKHREIFPAWAYRSIIYIIDLYGYAGNNLIIILIIIKLYCHIQRALHDELDCSLALTHIVPIYTIKYGK